MAIYSNGQVGWKSGIIPVTPLLLDTYSGAAAAYSLRKLRNAYAGSAIRVRRSSDNTTLDVGFDANGNLDTASMLSFVGSNNQALYSEEFDNTYWSKYITTVTPNQTTAPDGTMTADLLAESTANNYHTLYNATSLSFAVGTSWNVSVYVKKGPGTSAPDTIILGFPSPTGNVFSLPCVLFNISSGTVLDSSNASNDANFGSSIVDAGNGWWRCSVWGTVTVAGNRSQVGVIRFNNNLNTLNTSLYPGNVQSNIYIWGYQFQKALNDTSVLTTQPYTKTTATIAAGNGFVSIWYDQSENGRNANQTTSLRQPKIVNSGSLIYENGKVSVDFDGINNRMYTSTLTNWTNSGFSTYVVSKSGGLNSNGRGIFAISNGGNNNGYLHLLLRNNITNNFRLYYSIDGGDAGSQIQYPTNTFPTTQNLISTTRPTSGNITFKLNNILQSSIVANNINPSTPLSGNFIIGNYFTQDNQSLFYLHQGTISEIVVYPNSQESNTNGIASNINTYYSIY